MSHLIQPPEERKRKVQAELGSRLSIVEEGIDLSNDSWKRYCESHDCWKRYSESESFVDLYDDRFHHLCIIEAVRHNLSPEQANAYDRRFECLDILALHQFSCPPEKANRYHPEITPWKLPIFVYYGIPPEDLTDETIDTWLPLLEKMYNNHEGLRIILSCDFEGPFSCIGMGKHGFLLFGESSHSAFKFGLDLSGEATLYQKLQDVHQSQKNILKYKRRIPFPGFDVLEVEHIKGRTLKSIIESEGVLSEQRIVKYTSDMLHGLAVLRAAGIYHRDLHDRNVMIDEGNDRAVIIDLGAATTDPTEVYEGNRAYGGNNDLISLGLLMYKMATGRNLFQEGGRFSTYSEVKEGIKTEREKAYDDQKLKQQSLQKVRRDVLGKDLADVVVTLLDDELWTQPSLTRVEEVKKRLENT